MSILKARGSLILAEFVINHDGNQQANFTNQQSLVPVFFEVINLKIRNRNCRKSDIVLRNLQQDFIRLGIAGLLSKNIVTYLLKKNKLDDGV